jgi:hypothetical protein
MKKVLVPAVLSLALFACASTDKEIKQPTTSSQTTTTEQTTTTVKQLTKEDDVTSIQRDESNGSFTQVIVTVQNHSSKTSNYLIEVAAVTPDGKKQLGGTIATVSGLEPDQVAEAKSLFSSELPSDAVFKTSKITRYAS